MWSPNRPYLGQDDLRGIPSPEVGGLLLERSQMLARSPGPLRDLLDATELAECSEAMGVRRSVSASQRRIAGDNDRLKTFSKA